MTSRPPLVDGALTVTYAADAGACAMVPLLLALDDAGTYATAMNADTAPGGVVHTHTALAFRLEPETDPARSRQGA